MSLSCLLLVLLAAGAQPFTVTNIVSQLPLPGGGFYTNQSTVHVRLLSTPATISVLPENEIPNAPSSLIAYPYQPTVLIAQWKYSSNAPTDFVFCVYKSTNLLTWAFYTNLPPTARSNHFETWHDVRGFFKFSASNDAGEVFIPRK